MQAIEDRQHETVISKSGKALDRVLEGNFDIVARIESYMGMISSIQAEMWDEDGETLQKHMYVILHVKDGRLINALIDCGYFTEEEATRYARRPCLTSKGWVVE